jgi:two-component system sensor histidine kinase QseC
MVTYSIRFRLLMMILLTVFLLWTAVLCFTWWQTNRDIKNVYDEELVKVAKLLAVATAHEAGENDLKDYAGDMVHVAELLAEATAIEDKERDLGGNEAGLNDAGQNYSLIFQIWTLNNHLMVRGPGAPAHPLSATQGDGFSDVSLNNAGWRVYTESLPDKSFRIQVARSHTVIRRMVNEFVIDVVKPLLLALPLFGMLLLVVDRGLEPLRQVSRLIAERDYANLKPVAVKRIPVESSGLVNEINGLLKRLRASIERNSRFTADVAHELRTPIAGMLVQLQSDDVGLDEEKRRQVIVKVRLGLERLNHVVDQLLVLASIEPEKIRQSFERLDLVRIAEDVMSDLSPLALEKQIELELDAQEPAVIYGNRELIGILISNLVGNAIKFTPEGGEVYVHFAYATDGIYLSVEDTGPGIPEEKKSWVFERLNRTSKGGGTGLGLSIVKEICQLHQATINLRDKKSGSGLIVNLFLPALSKS